MGLEPGTTKAQVRRCLVRDMPKECHTDLDFIVDQLDWDKNVDPHFKENHYLEPVPVADTHGEGFMDLWIVYGEGDGEQLFTAKELTVSPGVKTTIPDAGAYGLFAFRELARSTVGPSTARTSSASMNSPKRIFYHRGRRKSRHHL